MKTTDCHHFKNYMNCCGVSTCFRIFPNGRKFGKHVYIIFHITQLIPDKGLSFQCLAYIRNMSGIYILDLFSIIYSKDNFSAVNLNIDQDLILINCGKDENHKEFHS